MVAHWEQMLKIIPQHADRSWFSDVISEKNGYTLIELNSDGTSTDIRARR